MAYPGGQAQPWLQPQPQQQQQQSPQQQPAAAMAARAAAAYQPQRPAFPQQQPQQFQQQAPAPQQQAQQQQFPTPVSRSQTPISPMAANTMVRAGVTPHPLRPEMPRGYGAPSQPQQQQQQQPPPQLQGQQPQVQQQPQIQQQQQQRPAAGASAFQGGAFNPASVLPGSSAAAAAQPQPQPQQQQQQYNGNAAAAAAAQSHPNYSQQSQQQKQAPLPHCAQAQQQAQPQQQSLADQMQFMAVSQPPQQQQQPAALLSSPNQRLVEQYRQQQPAQQQPAMNYGYNPAQQQPQPQQQQHHQQQPLPPAAARPRPPLAQLPGSSPAPSAAAPAAAKPQSKIDPDSVPRPSSAAPDPKAPLREYQTCLTNAAGQLFANGAPPAADADFRVVDGGNANPRFLRLSCYRIAQTAQVVEQSGLAVGAILQPLAELPASDGTVPVVELFPDGFWESSAVEQELRELQLQMQQAVMGQSAQPQHQQQPQWGAYATGNPPSLLDSLPDLSSGPAGSDTDDSDDEDFDLEEQAAAQAGLQPAADPTVRELERRQRVLLRRRAKERRKRALKLSRLSNLPQQLNPVDFQAREPMRCQHCNAYVNPWWRWEAGGAKYRCNLCTQVGDTPDWYRSHLDANGDRRDRLERPELHRGTVEYTAPLRFWRSLSPSLSAVSRPCWVFAIDVGPTAYLSGFIHSAVHALRYALRAMAWSSPQARVILLTHDSDKIGFFRMRQSRGGPPEVLPHGVDHAGGGLDSRQLNGFSPAPPVAAGAAADGSEDEEEDTAEFLATLSALSPDQQKAARKARKAGRRRGKLLRDPQLLAMTDLEDPFLPCPARDLMLRPVSRSSLQLLETTLDVILRTFAPDSRMATAPAELRVERGAAGAAAVAAGKALRGCGGKILLFQTSLCRQGPGALVNRMHPAFDLANNRSLLDGLELDAHGNPVSGKQKKQADPGAENPFATPGGAAPAASSGGGGSVGKRLWGGKRLERSDLTPEMLDELLLAYQTEFYSRLALEFAEHGLTVDMFLGPCARVHQQLGLAAAGDPVPGYLDLPSVGPLAKLTGGQVYMYNDFSAQTHGEALANDVYRDCTRATYGRCVMALRGSPQLTRKRVLGCISNSRNDLMLPTLDCDKAFGLGWSHSGALAESAAFQASLLFTLPSGERRLRVHTIQVPTTKRIADIYKYSDYRAILLHSLKWVADEVIHAGAITSEAKETLIKACIETLFSYRRHCASGVGTEQLILPEPLKLLPLDTLGLVKHPLLSLSDHPTVRGGCWPDLRMQLFLAVCQMGTLPSVGFVRPVIFSLLDIPDDCCVPGADGRLAPPPLLSVSVREMQPAGVYLLHRDREIVVYVSEQADLEAAARLLGLPNRIDDPAREQPATPELLEACTSVTVPAEAAAAAASSQAVHPAVKLSHLLAYLRSRSHEYPRLSVVAALPGNPSLLRPAQVEPPRLCATRQLLVEDHSPPHMGNRRDKDLTQMSYIDFLCWMHNRIQMRFVPT